MILYDEPIRLQSRVDLGKKLSYVQLGSTPNPVAVTTRIIPCLVRNLYHPFNSYWVGEADPFTVKVDTLPLELEQQARLFAGRHIVPWPFFEIDGTMGEFPKRMGRCQR